LDHAGTSFLHTARVLLSEGQVLVRGAGSITTGVDIISSPCHVQCSASIVGSIAAKISPLSPS
jgi:hypothetical protein